MGNKVYYKTVISLEEQDIIISPMDEGIVVTISENCYEENNKINLCLNNDEMELLILKMKEMMDTIRK